MPFITYKSLGQTITVPLTGTDTSIGRGHDAVIRIQNDTEISRIHCSVQKRDDEFVLLDAASRNGTFLNGDRLTTEEAPLADHDSIRAGHTTFTFLLAKPRPPEEEALEDLAREMEEGKGFTTILKEIVDQSGRS